jgi:hypothetical protein
MDIIAAAFFFLSGGADSFWMLGSSHFLFCGLMVWVGKAETTTAFSQLLEQHH